MGIKNNRLTKTLCIVACAAVIGSSFTVSKFKTKVNAETKPAAKNVIMLIPDGMNIEAETAARWYNGGKPLTIDTICSGLVKTNWAGGPITDSAPGGTAYATGHKSDDAHVGVSTKNTGEKPYATVLEAAKLKGKSTGVVVTCEFPHATPADFTAHAPARSDYNSIMKQEIYNGLDVVLGGGTDLLGADKAKNKRGEATDLTTTIKGLGYEYVTTRDQMLASKSNKLWGMFAPMDLQYDLDRETKPEEPSIEEMTKKAIEVLSKDQDGFFLMVEGSKIDWAAHANDSAGVVGDIAAFDKAVKAALDFAKNDGNTVVVVATDHGTGGMTIGNSALNSNYSKATFDQTVNKLKGVSATVQYIAPSLVGKADAEIIAEVNKNFGINDLTAEEIASIKAGEKDKSGKDTGMDKNGIYNLANVLSKRAGIGWTTSGHVGGDIALYNYAPSNIESLKGVVDNTDIGNYMARIMNVNLDTTTNELFLDAKTEFQKLGAAITVDAQTDSKNPVAIVTKGNNTMKLYVNTNKAEINGKTVNLNGVIVYSNSAVYVSKMAVDSFQNALSSANGTGNTGSSSTSATTSGNTDTSSSNASNSSNIQNSILNSKTIGSMPKTGAPIDMSIILIFGSILIVAGGTIFVFKKKNENENLTVESK